VRLKIFLQQVHDPGHDLDRLPQFISGNQKIRASHTDQVTKVPAIKVALYCRESENL